MPAGLRPLIGHCLAKDPALRPTADEVLATANDGQPVSGWLPGEAWTQSPRPGLPNCPGPPGRPGDPRGAAGGGR